MRSSVGVRSVGAERVAVRACSSRARSPHCCAPEPVEQLGGACEQLARLALLLETAPHLAGDEQRARELERHRTGVVLFERAIERVGGAVDAALGGQHETVAARGHRAVPRDPRAGRRSCELGEDRARAVEVAGSDRSLDRVAFDAPDRRLAEADPLPRRDGRARAASKPPCSRRRRDRRDRERGPRASARPARPSWPPPAHRRPVRDGRRRTRARCCRRSCRPR